MYILHTKFVKILELHKLFSENLVNESGNVPHRGPVPKFSDMEVVALPLVAEIEGIDSEKWLWLLFLCFAEHAFISALVILQYVNFINKSIGRIKYAPACIMNNLG